MSSNSSNILEAPNRNIKVNNQLAKPLGAELNPENATLRFTTNGLKYPKGIGEELLAVTHEFSELTNEFRQSYSSTYRFKENEDNRKPWFHTAEFWPYTDNSIENLFHTIKYSYTESRNMTSLNEEPDQPYPFEETSVISFFDPITSNVRVFSHCADNPPPAAIASQVFQPSLHIYLSTLDELLQVIIRAKGFQDPYEDQKHDLEQLPPAHVDSIRRARKTGSTVSWEITEYTLTGDLWKLVNDLAQNHREGIRPDSFRLNKQIQTYLDK